MEPLIAKAQEDILGLDMQTGFSLLLRSTILSQGHAMRQAALICHLQPTMMCSSKPRTYAVDQPWVENNFEPKKTLPRYVISVFFLSVRKLTNPVTAPS